MPLYKERTYNAFTVTKEVETANAVEMIAGLSYAAATEGRHLREGQSLEFPSEDSKLCWTRAWKVFQQLGLSDQEPAPETSQEVEGRFAMSMEEYKRLQAGGAESSSAAQEAPIVGSVAREIGATSQSRPEGAQQMEVDDPRDQAENPEVTGPVPGPSQPCEPRPEPAAGASGSKDAVADDKIEVDLSEEDILSDVGDENDSEPEQTIVTPVLDSNAVVNLLAGGVPRDDFEW